MDKIILDIQDFYDMRKRKQDELEFYHRELEKIQVKMSMLRVEMTVTNTIIDLIERENIIDLREYVRSRSQKGS
jgi:hypothetical protein